MKEWADRQESMGHELSADDLLEEFQLSLEATVFEMEEEKKEEDDGSISHTLELGGTRRIMSIEK